MNPVLSNNYCCIAVENFIPDLYEPTSSVIRVRPLADQNVSQNLRVECSKGCLRSSFPLGTVFLLKAKLTNRQGAPFIYSYFNHPFYVIKREDAERLIKEKRLGFFESAIFRGFSEFSSVIIDPDEYLKNPT